MGACLSSSSTIVDQKQLTSYVISINGELRQYSVPINVSQVLQSDISSDHASSFLCSSDRLYFDDFIPSLDSQYQLLPGQIYFMLPASKLKYRLSASDMAALAVKASAALEDLNKNKNKNKNKSRKSRKIMSKKRISPMLLQVEEDDYTQTNNKSTVGLGISMRSASVRKLQRLSSRRAKMAVRSFPLMMRLELELDCPSPPAAPHALDHVLNMSPTPVEPHNHHSSFCCNSNHTPKFQRNCVSLQSSMELMKEITTLEIEIMRLERYLLSLYRTAFQQNLPLLLENQKIHSQGKISSPTQCTTDQSYSDVEIDTSICGADQYDRISAAHALTGVSDKIQTANKSSSIREKLTDSAHRSLADHLTASRMDDILSYPDRLSEEIVKCISCIYCKFANPKILATKGLSVSSTSSLSSSSTFSPRNLSGSWSSHHNEESTEQYEFEVCKDDNRPYSTMIEILKICLDDDSFNYATTMLHKFRSLVKSLEKVDPRNMRREEKLTFWINIHNALVMHAYLAYGTQNSVRSSSILKAAYNVGGHCVNAYVIQSSILGILPHYSAPWLRTLFSPGKKFATGNCRHTYAIEYPEPLVHFALSLGASSDPSIQVYTAKNVFQDLKVAKEEFIRATVCINKDKRIYLPKIICYFAKDMSLSTDEVVETVMGSLPETQMKLVRSCMEYRADKLIYWLPQSCTFRYLIQKQVIQGRLSI